jgi:hypothetical protein
MKAGNDGTLGHKFDSAHVKRSYALSRLQSSYPNRDMKLVHHRDASVKAVCILTIKLWPLRHCQENIAQSCLYET